MADKQFNNALLAFKSHFSQNQRPGEYKAIAGMNDMLWAWGLVSKYKL